MRLLILAAALLPTPALAELVVGGEQFAQADILDARAVPDAAGKPAVLITFTEKAAKRYGKIAAAHVGKTLAFVLDGKPLAEPLMGNADDEGAVQLSGEFGGFEGAAAIAKQVSGKEPVPDEFAD